MSFPRRQLPPELIIEVIEYSASAGSEPLATLCIVSSVFWAWTLPVLYRTVHLSTEAQFSCFAKAKYNVDHTRHLSLSLKHTGIPNHAVNRLLHRLVHLRRVRLSADYLSYASCAPSASHLHIFGHNHWMRYTSLPHITHLYLENPHALTGLREEHIEHMFPALTHAAIISVELEAAKLSEVVRKWLALPRLRRLTLTLVFDNAALREQALPQLLAKVCMMDTRRAYVHVYATEGPVALSELLQPATGYRPARAAPLYRQRLRMDHGRVVGEALGRDDFWGKCDIWSLGACLWQESPEQVGGRIP